MTSEIDKLKHFHVEDYSGTNFTDDLNDGEEFLYTTIRCKDDKEVTLSEAIYKYRTNTGKMTASDYTHLFGYLNPYYRSAYNIPKRRK
ncbi:MAG: hypothetical protein [Bacteriophage sp.]|nr:MAG: hypothetical protein [Bacteriophage sp.]